jgi:hypothetical protein
MFNNRKYFGNFIILNIQKFNTVMKNRVIIL